jgi:AAA+ ATPase superfamily predicted ATPase
MIIIIVIQQFIGRRSELESLEREFKKNTASLAVVYGRRRVGKTELLLNFAKERGHIFFQADRRGYRENLAEFQRIAAETLNKPLLERARFESWHEMFRELLPILSDTRLVVIDEYPYLVEEGANEEFQRIWDTLLYSCTQQLPGTATSSRRQVMLGEHTRNPAPGQGSSGDTHRHDVLGTGGRAPPRPS